MKIELPEPVEFRGETLSEVEFAAAGIVWGMDSITCTLTQVHLGDFIFPPRPGIPLKVELTEETTLAEVPFLVVQAIVDQFGTVPTPKPDAGLVIEEDIEEDDPALGDDPEDPRYEWVEAEE